MVSKAIASLDAWLVRAEDLLREQREQALSPSTSPWDPRQEESIVPLARFLEGLEGLLDDLCRRPGRWILIAEDNLHRHHFWQALAFEDGSLVTEVVSNHYLEGDDRWSPAQEERLAALGWEEPGPPRRTNWITVEATTSPAIEEVANRAVQTLAEVFGLRGESQVFVKIFGSPLRGNTPASPKYESTGDADYAGASGSRAS